MPPKIIVFDVDGVITNSASQKDKIIENILEKYWLLHLPWVATILEKWLNRIMILEEISKIEDFDRQKVLDDINVSLLSLESSLTLIEDTINFIKKYHQEYIFFTNSSLPKEKLLRIFEKHNLTQYFMELLAYDDGSKRENIEYIMQVYTINPRDILFIDDKQAHIDAVKSLGTHSLLYVQDGVSLEEKIKNVF